MNMRISTSEMLKRFQFIDEIMKPQTDFRKQVLESFYRIFGYKKGVFWETDETGRIYKNPILLNFSPSIMSQYLDIYEEADPIRNVIIKNAVNCYSDYFPYKEYKETDFFKLIYSWNIRDVIFLQIKDNTRSIGTLCFYHSMDEGEFTIYDKNRMLFLSTYISMLLNFYELKEHKERNKKIEEFAEFLSIGVIITEQSLHIKYFNLKALEFSKQLIRSNIDPINELMEKIMRDYLNKPNRNKNFIIPDFPNMNVRIELLESTKQFVILLIPNSPDRNQIVTDTSSLTQREVEIAELLMRGYSYLEISEHLFISINTVKRHVQNIYNKVGVKNRSELSFLLNPPSRY